MAYNINELDLKDDSEKEHKRTRVIFEDLKEKSKRDDILTEHEKDFFCQGVKLSKLEDGKIEDYQCCSNYKFKITYLTYFHNLAGSGTYTKPKGTTLYQPTWNEINKDIEYLKSVSLSWQHQIEISNHSNELMQQISAETREDMRSLDKNRGRLLFARDKEKYVLDRRRIILQSKYTYCRILQIFEMYKAEDFLLKINNKEIEINEASLVHIFNRHFSKITKPNSTKSFHIEDFDPKLLNKQLQSIFELIDKSGLFAGQPIDRIAFKYEGINYLVWINKRTKQIKGRGNVEFNRLETFYPITDSNELQELKTNYDLGKVTEDLEVYVKKK